MKKLRESDIEKYLVKRVKEAGGEIRKVKWIGRRGAPDRIIFWPYRNTINCIVFVEVKAPGEKATEAQEREMKIIRKSDIPAFCVNSIKGVDQIISGYYKQTDAKKFSKKFRTYYNRFYFSVPEDRK